MIRSSAHALPDVTRKGPLMGLLRGREPNRALSMRRERAAPVVQVQRMLGGRRT